jgi:hypothetical protein
MERALRQGQLGCFFDLLCGSAARGWLASRPYLWCSYRQALQNYLHTYNYNPTLVTRPPRHYNRLLPGRSIPFVFSSWLLQSPTGATVRHSTQCCAPESAILRGQSPTRPQQHREERIAKRQGNRFRILLGRYLILAVPICRQYSLTRTKRPSSGRCPKPPTRSRLSL